MAASASSRHRRFMSSSCSRAHLDSSRNQSARARRSSRRPSRRSSRRSSTTIDVFTRALSRCSRIVRRGVVVFSSPPLRRSSTIAENLKLALHNQKRRLASGRSVAASTLVVNTLAAARASACVAAESATARRREPSVRARSLIGRFVYTKTATSILWSGRSHSRRVARRASRLQSIGHANYRRRQPALEWRERRRRATRGAASVECRREQPFARFESLLRSRRPLLIACTCGLQLSRRRLRAGDMQRALALAALAANGDEWRRVAATARLRAKLLPSLSLPLHTRRRCYAEKCNR